jgi:heptosyltransferase I
MHVLLVKTSSLGDVIHNLPVATDIARAFPGAVIDWVVEEAFADIPRLHPAVRHVIPVAVRRWRKQLLAARTWDGLREFRRVVRGEPYDAVIDTQGLLKSALIAWQARGKRFGYAAGSAREPVAARFYDRRFDVPKSLHAVERNRLLAAAALGYALPEPDANGPDYGLEVTRDPRGNSAVLLTATSRADKLWPEERWIALGKRLTSIGLECRLPAGSAAERERAARIAGQIPGASVVPPSSLMELARLLASARVAVGVDTGLIHLATALGCPSIALFCASEPALTGVHGGTTAINLGHRGAAPDTETVIAAVASAVA